MLERVLERRRRRVVDDVAALNGRIQGVKQRARVRQRRRRRRTSSSGASGAAASALGAGALGALAAGAGAGAGAPNANDMSRDARVDVPHSRARRADRRRADSRADRRARASARRRDAARGDDGARGDVEGCATAPPGRTAVKRRRIRARRGRRMSHRAGRRARESLVVVARRGSRGPGRVLGATRSSRTWRWTRTDAGTRRG